MILSSNNFNILTNVMVLSDVQCDDSSTFLIPKGVLFTMLGREICIAQLLYSIWQLIVLICLSIKYKKYKIQQYALGILLSQCHFLHSGFFPIYRYINFYTILSLLVHSIYWFIKTYVIYSIQLFYLNFLSNFKSIKI